MFAEFGDYDKKTLSYTLKKDKFCGKWSIS